MGQEFLAVRCFQCSKFQVQMAKKATKFKCSVCGTQQPLQHVVARSARAKDCRLVVQQYNEAHGGLEDEAVWQDEGDAGADLEPCYQQQQQAAGWAQPSGGSHRWDDFVEEGEETGWTVALPEAQAPPERQQRPAKRRREQQQAAEPAYAGGGWPQQQQQQQPQWAAEQAPPGSGWPQQQQPQRQQPFAERGANAANGSAAAAPGGGWGGGKPASPEGRRAPAQQAPAAAAGRKWNAFVSEDDF